MKTKNLKWGLLFLSIVMTTVGLSQRRERGDRYGSSNEKTQIRKEVNEKYRAIKKNLNKITDFFAPSSADEYPEFKEGVMFFSEQKLSLSDIQKMIDDPAEKERIKDVGQIINRDAVEKELPPGLLALLKQKESSVYSLSFLSDQIDKVSEWATVAKSGGQYANENARKVKDFYQTMLLFQAFADNHTSLDQYVQNAKAISDSVVQKLKTEYEKYKAGDFHKNQGSGIYFVQKNGVTPQNITASDVTEKIIIDGKTPVHIFVLTDMNLRSYGSYLQLDIVDEGSGRHQNKYVFDDSKVIPLNESDEKAGYKKLVFIPSNDWADMDDNYDVSQFYSCYIQEKLANELVPGQPKKLTFYAANGQLKRTVTIEATESGIKFLKGMKAKMEKYEVDAARMEKAAVIDSKLQDQISGLFKRQNGNIESIKRVVITSEPWYIEKDAWGNITHRHCYAQVAFQGTDGNFYIQKVHCTQRYENGTYQSLKVNTRFEARRIRKENIQ